MSVENGIIKAPIRTSEVASCIGEPSLDVGTLCKSGRVNKFSRMKPIVKATVMELTEADMLAANWGMDIRDTSITNVRANGISTWVYNQPTGGDNAPYRLLDFNGYNHYSTSPLIFSFNDLTDIITYDSLAGVPPVVLVRWRPDTVRASQGIGVNGISLSDMKYTGPTTNKLQDLRPCVTRYANGVLFVANANHTLAETDFLDNNPIILSDFNIWNGGWTNSNASDWLGTVNIPEGAANVKYMELYPRLNKMSNVSQLRMTSTGAPTDEVGQNGWYNQNETYPFTGVPQENKLIIVRYEYTPISVRMNYAEIVYGNSGASIIGMWPFLGQNNLSPNDPGIQSFGQSGRSIPFSVAPIVVRISCTIYNSAGYAVTIRPTTITGGGTTSGPIPNNSISLVESDGNTATSLSGYISIPAHGSKDLTIVSSYSPGQYPDYTFPRISYGYGTFYVLPKLKMLVNTTYRDEFVPNQEGENRALCWK